MDFVAVDVETANADAGSVCAAGIAEVRAGRVEGVWARRPDPEAPVSLLDTRVHGMTASDPAGLRGLSEAWGDIGATRITRASRSIVSSTSHLPRRRQCNGRGEPASPCRGRLGATFDGTGWFRRIRAATRLAVSRFHQGRIGSPWDKGRRAGTGSRGPSGGHAAGPPGPYWAGPIRSMRSPSGGHSPRLSQLLVIT